MNFPDDADGDALRRVASNSDLTKPMDIDFVVVLPNEDNAKQLASRAAKLGYDPSIEYDDESEEWACYCTRRMIPTYDGIVAAQKELDSACNDLGGYTDGWGTFGTNEQGECSI